MQGNKILIIEDDADIAAVVEFALSRAGMVCAHAATADEGLAVLARQACDLLILDVGLPDRDGFELLKTLRHSSRIPVIMLTAQHEEIDRILGLELGADDYIGKPFSPRELVARIKTVLKRCSGENEALSPGVFYYDRLRQQVYFGQTPLTLTLAELRLFTHMLAHPGQVFSREQLLIAVFSAHHPSDSRTIDTHIKTLRRKLREAGCGQEIIMTHRALGYSVQI